MKQPTQGFSKKLKESRPHITVLEYYGTKANALCYCSLHNLEFWRTPDSLFKAHGCPVCGEEFRRTDRSDKWLAEHKAIILKKFGKKLQFIGPYIGSRFATSYKCSKHGIFKAKPCYVDGYTYQCPECHGESRGRVQLLDTDEVKKEIQSRMPSLKIAYSDYTGQKEPVRWKCIAHGTSGTNILDALRKRKHCCNVAEKASRPLLMRKDEKTFVKEIKQVSPQITVLHYAGSQKKCTVKCKKCNIVWKALGTSLSSGHGCPRCSSGNRISKAEEELFSIIKRKFPDATQSDRSIIRPKELDIVIPSKKIAIEYNGSFYHNELVVGKYAHELKSLLCRIAGWRLIHIHEVDWIHNKKVVLKTLAHALDITKKRFFARNLELRSVTGNEAIKFFQANHMQGLSYHPKVTLGLFDGQKPVAMMSFDRNRRDKSQDGEFHLSRYASIGTVVGGASRLFANFVKQHHPKKIVSFSANDLFDGRMYEMLGFKLEKEVPPDYFVLLNGYKRNKQAVTRIKLKALLGENFDPNKSERENCYENNILRVFDSGKKKWVKYF